MADRFVDRGVLVEAAVGLALGLIEYLVLKLFLNEEALFWKSLSTTIAAVATTQVWLDATSFPPSSSLLRVSAPALCTVIFALVVGFTAVDPSRGNFERSAYGWALAAVALCGVHRQVGS
jgi:hypothetical protein